MKGTGYAFNGPHLGNSHHRQTTSQEFGYDLCLIDKNDKLYTKKGIYNSDFPTFGKFVLAPANGQVVKVYDGMPDNPRAGQVPEISDARILKWGLEHAVAGNLVVIKHKNNEYSFLAHFALNSIKVKVGQKVKAGDQIGKLGNSGNSLGPHLHYHLMDGEDLFTSRSLPMEFCNVDQYPFEGVSRGDQLSFQTPMFKTSSITNDGR